MSNEFTPGAPSPLPKLVEEAFVAVHPCRDTADKNDSADGISCNPGISVRQRLLRIQNWEALARRANYQPALMADLCPISLRHLERFFKRNFKKTPRAWTRTLRCELARRFIEQGWSNKAVVAELGFADASHFCHEFRKVYGVSPQNCSRLFAENLT
jgi:AraC-like DNA-binding protein